MHDAGAPYTVPVLSSPLDVPGNHGTLDFARSLERSEEDHSENLPAEIFSLPYDRRVWAYINLRLNRGRRQVDLLRKLKMFAHSQLRRRAISTWQNQPFGRHAAEIVWRHPLLPITKELPYIDSRWSVAQKRAVIVGHYSQLDGPRAALDFPLYQRRTLLLLDEILPTLRVVVDKPSWFFNEGEVVINLFVDDQRIYSLAFTLGLQNGSKIAYVGALQGGGHGEAVLERNRLLTRAAHGLRPRDLLFATFRLLCDALELERICAPLDRHSVLRGSYFSSKRGAEDLSYDAIWTEFGGTVSEQSGMFEMPVALSVRGADEIPPKKRALYRRRYEFLEQMKIAIRRHVTEA